MNNSFIFNVFKKPFLSFQTVFYPEETEHKEKLVAPVINVIQDSEHDYKVQISWSAIANAEKYRVYVGSVMIGTTTETSIQYEIQKNGIYSIYVKAYGAGFNPSAKSNVITLLITSIGVFLSTKLNRKILANGRKILIKQGW